MKLKYLILVVALLNLTLISAIDVCKPVVSLINQDPYPAIPGEYVKLVFQIDDLDNPLCGSMSFELLEQYPLIFDPNTNAKIDIKSGFYERDFSSFLIAPYKVRVDESALEGDNPIEVMYSYGTTVTTESKQFNLYIEDARAEFEIHIDKYSYTTQELTLEVLNIADTDVEALTIEIPKQDNLNVIGTSRVVVGDLDSNEYTTADFKASDIKDGDLEVNVIYTDQTGIRRQLTKTINFDSSYFADTKVSNQTSWSTYILILVIAGLVVWWFMNRRKKKKERMKRRGEARLG